MAACIVIVFCLLWPTVRIRFPMRHFVSRPERNSRIRTPARDRQAGLENSFLRLYTDLLLEENNMQKVTPPNPGANEGAWSK